MDVEGRTEGYPGRKAINLAIDRKTIVAQAFFGVAALPRAYTIRHPARLRHQAWPTSAPRTSRREGTHQQAGAAGTSLTLIYENDLHPAAPRSSPRTSRHRRRSPSKASPPRPSPRSVPTESEGHELMMWERNTYVPDPNNMIGSLAFPYGSTGTSCPATRRCWSRQVRDHAHHDQEPPHRGGAGCRVHEGSRGMGEEFMVLPCCATPRTCHDHRGLTGLNVDALSNFAACPEGASV